MLAAPIEQFSDSYVNLQGVFKGYPVPVNQVARLQMRPFSRAAASQLQPGRTGVLLSKGDFLEGQVGGLDHGKIRVSSVLFGMRSWKPRRRSARLSCATRSLYPQPTSSSSLMGPPLEPPR